MFTGELSLSARSVPLPPLERARAASRAGFTGMGITIREFRDAAASNEAESLIESIRGEGVAVTEIEFLHRWTDPSDPQQIRDENDALRLAGSTGLRQVTVGSVEPAPPGVDIAGEFVRLCERVDLQVLLEFMPFGSVPNLEIAADLVRITANRGSKLLLDSWHWSLAMRNDRGSMNRLGRGRLVDRGIDRQAIGRVQIAGSRPEAVSTREESLSQRRVPSTDDGDLMDFLRELRLLGYAGPFSCEVIRLTMNPSEIDDFLRECAVGTRRVLAEAGYA